MEVFSFGCPACNTFRPVMKKLKAALPPNAQLTYLHASWNAAEAWPLFQRSFITAQSLGIEAKAHDAMYDAIWASGELRVADPKTFRPLSKLPKIEDVAKFYQRVAGVKPEDFVNASKSFSVDLKMRQSDSQIIAMQVSGTPTSGGGRQVPPEQRQPDYRRNDPAGEFPGGEGKCTGGAGREERLMVSG